MKIESALLAIPFLAQAVSTQSYIRPYVASESGEPIVSPSVIVSVTIGVPKMALWGYGPPGSVLELSGVGVEQTTQSNETGYYLFDLVYVPAESFPELCVTAIDQNQRVTPPTCIPELPIGNYFYDIGPVILPPTLSLTHFSPAGNQIAAEGQTIPNSTVEIKLGRPSEQSKVLGLGVVGKVLAYYIPSYTVISDAGGNFSFNMPEKSTTWRVFAITDYQGVAKSPKSNTLVLEVLTTVASIWQKILAFIKALLVWPRILILETIIIIILILILLLVIRKKKKKAKKSTTQK